MARRDEERSEALRSANGILTEAPGEATAYRQLVLDLAEAVAEAKGGVKPSETSAIDKLKQTLGASNS